jgi:hypothetical protein
VSVPPRTGLHHHEFLFLHVGQRLESHVLTRLHSSPEAAAQVALLVALQVPGGAGLGGVGGGLGGQALDLQAGQGADGGAVEGGRRRVGERVRDAVDLLRRLALLVR